MSSLMLSTLNQYGGFSLTAEEAVDFLMNVCCGPIPDRLPEHDWRAHVPMHLLEDWLGLTDDERAAIYIMAQSATHAYECCGGQDDPTMN